MKMGLTGSVIIGAIPIVEEMGMNASATRFLFLRCVITANTIKGKGA
jgi:hypothetical protein